MFKCVEVKHTSSTYTQDNYFSVALKINLTRALCSFNYKPSKNSSQLLFSLLFTQSQIIYLNIFLVLDPGCTGYRELLSVVCRAKLLKSHVLGGYRRRSVQIHSLCWTSYVEKRRLLHTNRMCNFGSSAYAYAIKTYTMTMRRAILWCSCLMIHIFNAVGTRKPTTQRRGNSGSETVCARL